MSSRAPNARDVRSVDRREGEEITNPSHRLAIAHLETRAADELQPEISCSAGRKRRKNRGGHQIADHLLAKKKEKKGK